PDDMAPADGNGDGKPELITTHMFEAAGGVLRKVTPTPVHLTEVVSRKVHGGAGTFDVDLTDGTGIESRSGGTSGNYTLVFKFANPLANVGGASITSGTGSASGNIDSNDANSYVVNMTAVTNAQRI